MLVWLDSDTLVSSTIQPLLAQADRLEDPGSPRPGLRLGASYDVYWYRELNRGKIPKLGSAIDAINSGVFIIKPGV